MSTDSERDASTDRLLRATLRATDADAGPSCLDAERLAAWADGEIAGPEAAAVESHLAGCARCQAMLAAFARSEPDDTSAVTEPAAVTAPAPLVFRPRRTLRWFVPIAATAAAVVLMVVFWRPGAGPAPQISMTKVEAPATSPIAPVAPETTPAPVPPTPVSVAPVRATSGQLATPTERPAAKALPVPAAPTPAAAPVTPAALPPTPSPAAISVTARADLARPAALSGVVTDKDGGLVPGATVTVVATATGEKLPTQVTNALGAYAFPGLAAGSYRITIALQGFKTAQIDATLTADTTNALSTKLEVGAVNEVVAVKAGTELVRTDTPTVTQSVSANFVQTLPRSDRMAPGSLALLPGGGVEFGPPAIANTPSAGAGGTATARAAGAGGRGGGGGAQRVAQESAAAPRGPIRWRVSNTGVVTKSTDGGKTWVTMTVEAPAVLTSGAAPSASVCWLIGRAGTVLVSIDGLTFKPVTFPEAVDLRSVSATDARQATISTTTGVVYTTTDGGLTWKKSS